MAKLTFSVDSALLSEIGEKLVESVHVALLELVKNSYDADASKVSVEMVPSESTYKIVVDDNGSGMTYDEVKSFWMRIATTHKVEDDISTKYGRKKTGSKGIGRFSCRRLGDRLKIETTAKLGRKFQTTKLAIDWTDYIPGTDIDQIKCVGTKSESQSGQTGTRLEISGSSKDQWTHRGWDVLKRRLLLLVSNRGRKRRGFTADPGFNVSLTAPDFEEERIVDQRAELMDAGWGRLILRIDKKGHAIWSLTAKKIGTKEVALPETYEDLAGTTADISIFPQNKKHYRKPKAVAIVDLRTILQDWGGIHIRMDGVRVPPFGEGRDDWLHIDRDRGIRKGPSEFNPVSDLGAKLKGVDPSRALLSMLSFKAYVGEVNLQSPTGLLEMKASREGFVGELGLDLLREVVRFGIDWSTVYRDYYLRKEEKEEARRAKVEFEQAYEAEVQPREVVSTAVEYLKSELKQLATDLPTEQKQKIMSSIASATEAIVKTDSSQQNELRHLRLVASTSSLLLIFSHEVKSLLGMLEEFQVALGAMATHLPKNESNDVVSMKGQLKATKKRFVDLLNLTSLFSGDYKTEKPSRLALLPRILKAIDCFSLIVKQYEIEIDVSRVTPPTKIGPMLEAELYSILLNVLSNSIKSVIAKGGKRRIEIRAKKLSKGTRVNVLDTGVGVPRKWEGLFDAFISDPLGTFYPKLQEKINPADSYVVGTGSGLGLSIIREIIEAHEGSIGFAEPLGQWKCNLEILMP